MGAPKGNKYALDNNGGRPLTMINYGLLDELCEIQCTEEEIAKIMKIDADTLSAAIKRDMNKSFPEYFAEKRVAGKRSLRRRQYQSAVIDGNVTMLIWLGKQWLSQSDKQQIDMTTETVIVVSLQEIQEDNDTKEPEGADDQQ